MKKGVEEVGRGANSTELMVSRDGFWQTRGFRNSNGAASDISSNTTPKVLNIEICSKTCYICIDEFLFFLFS